MRTRFRKFAHVLERNGRRGKRPICRHPRGIDIPPLTSQAFLLIMTITVRWLYLGIDTPPAPFHPHDDEIDSTEFLSATGTFLAALAAFASVGIIVLRQETQQFIFFEPGALGRK
jgi:hypothetical protein